MYYLMWIGNSADTLCAPHCELATISEYSMYVYCKECISKYYPEGQYVVMCVKTLSGVPFTENGEYVFSQTTVSVTEFIHNYKEENHVI